MDTYTRNLLKSVAALENGKSRAIISLNYLRVIHEGGPLLVVEPVLEVSKGEVPQHLGHEIILILKQSLLP